jgi:hypothetical protein
MNHHSNRKLNHLIAETERPGRLDKHHTKYCRQHGFKRGRRKKSLRDHKRGEREIYVWEPSSQEFCGVVKEIDNDCKCSDPEYFLSKDENCLVCKHCFGLAKTGGTNGNLD